MCDDTTTQTAEQLDAYADELANVRAYEATGTDFAGEVRKIRQAGNAARHQLYVSHYGRVNDAGRKLNPIADHSPVLGPNRQPALANRPAFPDPFAAFDASVNGKSAEVAGYVRRDGRKVNRYWRKPANVNLQVTAA